MTDCSEKCLRRYSGSPAWEPEMSEDQAALRRRLRPRPRSSLPLINWSLPKISSPADYLKAYPDLMSTMVITEVVTICDKVTTLRKSNQLGVGVFKARSWKYSAAVAFSRSLHSFHFVTNMSSWCGHARLKVQTLWFSIVERKSSKSEIGPEEI